MGKVLGEDLVACGCGFMTILSICGRGLTTPTPTLLFGQIVVWHIDFWPIVTTPNDLKKATKMELPDSYELKGAVNYSCKKFYGTSYDHPK